MERDGPIIPTDELIPPPDPRAVYRTAAVGAGLCGAAALLGLGLDLNGMGGPGPWSTVRLVVTAAGLLTAGAALSLRAGLPLAWLIAVAACVLSWFGLPAHWDSARLVAGVTGCAALLGAFLTALPRTLRLAGLSLLAVYHFFGIFLATTWPDPTPWPTQQIGTRAFLPYLMFMYLRNAYHFYSPDPGPASLLYCLIEFEPETDPVTGRPVLDEKGNPKKAEHEWLKIPNRSEHLKDPLALTYYRRLSVTEQISQTIPDYLTPTSFEKLDVRQRRQQVAAGVFENYPQIPFAPEEIEQPIFQYRMPRPDVTRYLLPSYARHLLIANSRPGRKAVRVKIYRLEHRVIPVSTFASGMSPFHPLTYKPYFLGEYYLNPETDSGELVNPQDPMLYWLVPIVPKRPEAMKPPDQVRFEDETVDDYLSKHAGFDVKWRER
jgi:hypothetical protein